MQCLMKQIVSPVLPVFCLLSQVLEPLPSEESGRPIHNIV